MKILNDHSERKLVNITTNIGLFNAAAFEHAPVKYSVPSLMGDAAPDRPDLTEQRTPCTCGRVLRRAVHTGTRQPATEWEHCK